MKVSKLIEELQKYDGDTQVIIIGTSGGMGIFGCDFNIEEVFKWDNHGFVGVVAGEEFEEDEE